MSGIKKTVITVLGLFALLMVILFGSLVYITHYKVNTVDTQESPDGVYELKLQSVGDPYFPFGDTPGRLVLSENGTDISRTKFEIADDGAVLSAGAWNVTWQDNYVEIILSGSEQYDELFRLYYEGQVESETLDTHFGRDYEHWYINSAETTVDAEDETEQELSLDQQKIEEGYYAIYRYYFGDLPDDIEISYGASESSSKCILSENEDDVEYLIYDRESKNGQCGLYVYYRSETDEDGSWDYANGTIIDICAYVYDSGDVICSGKTHWEDSGSESYREVTGEE